MDSLPGLNEAELDLALSVADDLNSSLELETMFSNAREGLGRLIPMDAMALCISRPLGETLGYDWMPSGLDSSFFHHYQEVAPYDFVQASTTRAPNTVLRDSQMIPRAQLIRNPMYERLRELGQPIEHCMSVSLWVSPEWHGGVTLYSARRRPFSTRHQARMQWLTPRLARAISHCRTYAQTRSQASLLREVATRQGPFILVQGARLEHWTPTPSATALLAEWFSPSELAGGRLPEEFRARLASLARRAGGPDDGPEVWLKQGTDKDLRVSFESLPVLDSERAWLLQLQEKRSFIPLPESWRGRISNREAEVVSLAFRFWDYATIAEHLKIKVNTVKQHIESACDELAADNLKKLMALALSEV
ncbi:LuxR family transcriptional regulator [Cystobacter fuscus]|uniref:LuxR family transcriptional regulator n=1 Tax=Cystobacter fuscus TaxID=43 RepID=A0A250IWG5_9BACT|nr:LuxR family transcriptional regulator [Cystobacter fuscus]ATB35236.1 LuxR family transcriptional regulator [Cystobacter fuscus]